MWGKHLLLCCPIDNCFLFPVSQECGLLLNRKLGSCLLSWLFSIAVIRHHDLGKFLFEIYSLRGLEPIHNYYGREQGSKKAGLALEQ